MKRKLLYFWCLTIPHLGLGAQDTLYHLLDGLNEEPSVIEWNVSQQKAILSKNYIIEVTDDLARPVALYFYYYGLNRRGKIDDPEIILFMYKNKAIDIYTSYSRETDFSMWAVEDFRCLHYHIEFDEKHRIKDYSISSFVDTLRRREYIQKMNLQENNEETEDILLEEYHGVEACKDIRIPYLDFSYTKKCIGRRIGQGTGTFYNDKK